MKVQQLSSTSRSGLDKNVRTKQLAKLFRAQRNVYISGFAILLWMWGFFFFPVKYGECWKIICFSYITYISGFLSFLFYSIIAIISQNETSKEKKDKAEDLKKQNKLVNKVGSNNFLWTNASKKHTIYKNEILQSSVDYIWVTPL